jgi:hypothetical protein
MSTAQTELAFFQTTPDDPNVRWLIETLRGRGWMTASELLEVANRKVTETEKRKVRSWCRASEGQVLGNQQGYRLMDGMTYEEFQHWRNTRLAAADEDKRAVLEADQRWYARNPVPA